MFDDNDLRDELNENGSVARAEMHADNAVNHGGHSGEPFTFMLAHQRAMLHRQTPPRFVGGSPVAEAAAKESAVRYAIARMRLAKETEAVYRWLALPPVEIRGQIGNAAALGGQERLDRVREIAASHPILARWASEQKDFSDSIDAANRAHAALQRAAWLAEAPTRAIAAAEAEGAALTLDASGKRLVAQAGHRMTAATLDLLRENKEAVAAIIAARLVVVA